MGRGKEKLTQIGLSFVRQMITVTSYRHKVEQIFEWPWKMVSVSVRYLFYQPMDEKIKTWLFVFPPKKTVIWRRHCSIGQSCCSMTSKRSINWFLEIKVLASPIKITRVCIRSITQSNRSISVRLLFLFCSCVFISRSYENRSKDLCPQLKVQDLYFVCLDIPWQVQLLTAV